MPDSIFTGCKLQINGIAHVLPGEVPDMLRQGAILVDLREELETEIRAFGVEAIVYLPHSEFDDRWESLPLDKPLILADSVGIWSKKAALFLKSKGYNQVASLAGGMADWQKDGFPVIAGKYQPLNGPCPCMIKPHEKK
ncbi:MAG: rhodanese-like domain-containing protein [Bacteroidetes bacterium]|nr:rhodanese-like domain-containing protein [Bacteroidota bacterium]